MRTNLAKLLSYDNLLIDPLYDLNGKYFMSGLNNEQELGEYGKFH